MTQCPKDPTVRFDHWYADIRNYRVACSVFSKPHVGPRVSGKEWSPSRGHYSAIRVIEWAHIAAQSKLWILSIEQVLVAKYRRLDAVDAGESVPRPCIQESQSHVHSRCCK